jgi:hypothetical protein
MNYDIMIKFNHITLFLIILDKLIIYNRGRKFFVVVLVMTDRIALRRWTAQSPERGPYLTGPYLTHITLGEG